MGVSDAFLFNRSVREVPQRNADGWGVGLMEMQSNNDGFVRGDGFRLNVRARCAERGRFFRTTEIPSGSGRPAQTVCRCARKHLFRHCGTFAQDALNVEGFFARPKSDQVQGVPPEPCADVLESIFSGIAARSRKMR